MDLKEPLQIIRIAKKISLKNLQVCHLQSIYILSILDQPSSSWFTFSMLVFFFYLTKLIFCCFLPVEGNFTRSKKNCDVKPLNIL